METVLVHLVYLMAEFKLDSDLNVNAWYEDDKRI